MKRSWTYSEYNNRPRWTSPDGAVVKWDDSSPYPNSLNPNSRMYTAWVPDSEQTQGPCWESADYLYWTRRDSEFRFPRRWKTAEAAMKAMDKEFPLKD